MIKKTIISHKGTTINKLNKDLQI